MSPEMIGPETGPETGAEMGAALETTLTRELHQVAETTEVPPMPALPSDTDRRSLPVRLWQPLVVAASVVLLVGALALVLDRPDEAPAPSAPPGLAIPVTAPLVPYVVDQRLYVDGQQVPGTWSSVQWAGETWVGQQGDGSWWSGGPGRDTGAIYAELDQPPVISPDGGLVAFIDTSSGGAVLTGFDTRPAGEGLGSAPIDLPRTEGGVALRVGAVTSDGDVIVQGRRTSLMWRAGYQDQQSVVDLAETAPGQQVLAATSAGLIVVDGADADAQSSEPYLAEVSGDGRLTRTGPLPTYDAVEIDPAGTWLVRSPAGTLGGEVTSTSTLRAQAIGGSDEVTLEAPAGWGFASGTWTWEDDRTVLSVLLPEGGEDPARLVRCEVTVVRCRAFDAPAPPEQPTTEQPRSEQPASDGSGPPTSYDAESALADVIEAVVTDDRAALVDQDVIADGEWDQLVGMAAGGGGSGSTCRDNGGGTRDCEIVLLAHPDTVYYAILEPASNTYGWRVTYVSIASD